MQRQDYLTPAELAAWQPAREIPPPHRRSEPLIARLKDAGLWNGRQLAGRHWPIGCVSLEITQRCNLDCSLCYLSEYSEAVRDLPLEEVFRRIDMIYRHYGPNTNVQVTGGDPTLRERGELVKIVRRIREMGMRPCLFTNGIKATRELLSLLCDNGLVDVAFHVDMTQGRGGYRRERELNAVRRAYIERARGLPLAVYFNTTVFAGNFADIPEIVRFFRANADVVRLASFQLQADTGRGVLRGRAQRINPESVAGQISEGAGVELNFDVPLVGHPRCNRTAICLEANGNLYNLFDDPAFAMGILQRTAACDLDRRHRWKAIGSLLHAVLAHPDYWGQCAAFLGRKLWAMRRDVVEARGRVNKLTFFIHNFMDAARLEKERCETCVFMAATADGPLSMCVYNAKRDAHILKPLRIASDTGHRTWNPLAGRLPADGGKAAPPPASAANPAALPLRYLKGRTRQRMLEDRMLDDSAAPRGLSTCREANG
ncbi:MAG: radical SAM protein [SAR324 cluster bacterium]|nr:radical SAM protein [SAR324 cluster bacterium]